MKVYENYSNSVPMVENERQSKDNGSRNHLENCSLLDFVAPFQIKHLVIMNLILYKAR